MVNAIYLSIIAVLLVILFVTYREERRTRERSRYGVEEYWKGQERREFKRFPRVLQVSYAFRPADGKSLERRGNGGKTVSRDLSWGGIQLLIPEKLKAGTHLSLAIELEKSQTPVQAEGEVVWMEEALDKTQSDGTRVFRTGVKFLNFSSKGQDRLIKFLYESDSPP
ncbi:MAG: PilZ domain-containing protein [Candidatus Omnitrophica bacterium]|nr:PilZ domain-containing protein [Candidatus Omnitrophota bacterium]